MAAYAGSGAAFQRSPPGPTGYDYVLKNIDPARGQYFGGPYGPPDRIPPAQFSVWGFGSAVGSNLGGEYGAQPGGPGQVEGVPWLVTGEDTTGRLYDSGLPNPLVSIWARLCWHLATCQARAVLLLLLPLRWRAKTAALTGQEKGRVARCAQ